MSSPYEPTLVRSHVNGGSVIDLCLCDSSVSNLLTFVEKAVPFFTGAPSVSHCLICYELNITEPLKNSEIRGDLTRVNRDYMPSVLEVDVPENFGVLFQQLPSKLLQSINELQSIDKCNQFIPAKIESIHSNPYQNAKLCEPALDIKKARRKLKLNYTPSNKEFLVDLKLRTKEENWTNINRWTEKTVNDLNDTNSRYFRAVKRFKENSSSENKPFLIHDGEKVSSDANKAKVFEVFFKGGHFRDKCFDQFFLNELCQRLMRL